LVNLKYDKIICLHPNFVMILPQYAFKLYEIYAQVHSVFLLYHYPKPSSQFSLQQTLTCSPWNVGNQRVCLLLIRYGRTNYNCWYLRI